MKESNTLKQLTVDATVANVSVVTAFFDEYLEGLDCPMKAMMQIDVAVDELFGNIANYAYGDKVGKAVVRIDRTSDRPGVVIEFEDEGMKFDPLAKEDPDVTLSVNERGTGGLGIFIVKKTMDDVSYSYTDGKNILSIKKYF